MEVDAIVDLMNEYIEENQEIVKEEQIKIELPKGTTLEGRN